MSGVLHRATRWSTRDQSLRGGRGIGALIASCEETWGEVLGCGSGKRGAGRVFIWSGLTKPHVLLAELAYSSSISNGSMILTNPGVNVNVIVLLPVQLRRVFHAGWGIVIEKSLRRRVTVRIDGVNEVMV
jgi:hypothetical protein